MEKNQANQMATGIMAKRLTMVQRRKNEPVVLEAVIGGLAQRPRPRAHPPPEGILGVTLESPLDAPERTTLRPPETLALDGVALIVLEEASEHVHVAELAEGFARGA